MSFSLFLDASLSSRAARPFGPGFLGSPTTLRINTVVKTRNLHVVEVGVDEVPGVRRPDQEYERTEESRLLYAALGALDDAKRSVFVLFELEEMTAPQIAEALSIKLNTVYSRLRFARAEFETAVAECRRHRAGVFHA